MPAPSRSDDGRDEGEQGGGVRQARRQRPRGAQEEGGRARAGEGRQHGPGTLRQEELLGEVD